MYLILQQEHPEDFVIATGKTTEIREFVRMAFAEIGIEIVFEGSGADEKGYIKSCADERYQVPVGKEVLAVDPRYFRPTEVELLIGDPSKAKSKLNWEPEYDLKALVKDMMQSDIKLMHKEVYLKKGGYQTLNYFE
jgi:GDPmannose 4,6-dehydratase